MCVFACICKCLVLDLLHVCEKVPDGLCALVSSYVRAMCMCMACTCVADDVPRGSSGFQCAFCVYN